jgi:hypothetical protein
MRTRTWPADVWFMCDVQMSGALQHQRRHGTYSCEHSNSCCRLCVSCVEAVRRLLPDIQCAAVTFTTDTSVAGTRSRAASSTGNARACQVGKGMTNRHAGCTGGMQLPSSCCSPNTTFRNPKIAVAQDVDIYVGLDRCYPQRSS